MSDVLRRLFARRGSPEARDPVYCEPVYVVPVTEDATELVDDMGTGSYRLPCSCRQGLSRVGN